MTFFVKDYSTTMQARMLIFGMHVDDDLLYCGFGNKPSPACFSLYLSNFLSIYTFKNEIFFPSILSRMKFFVKDFLRTIQACVLIFGMQVDDDLLYRGIEN